MKKTWRNICFLLLAVLILAGYPQITHAAVSEAYGDYTVYNVTEYGADPTGAQACDAAISSALRAARKNSGKKLLYFRRSIDDGRLINILGDHRQAGC